MRQAQSGEPDAQVPCKDPLRVKWVGTYRTWEPKVRFGKHAPVPRLETKTVWAVSEGEARYCLARWMGGQGLALGGLLSVKKY